MIDFRNNYLHILNTKWFLDFRNHLTILSNNIANTTNNYFKLTKIFSLLLFIIFFLFPYAVTFAQVDSTGLLNDKIFQYLEDATQDKDDSQLYEIFDELLSNPVDINRATVNDLTTLPFISKLNAKKIVKFIKRKKGISSLDELRKIKNLDENILVLLKPFAKSIH